MSQTTCQLIGTSAVTSANIADGAVVNADVNASAGIVDSKLTGTTCKAWVNFNGTGTVAIRASYNVSSITDNGVGDYTVNFTTALADANYAMTANARGDGNAIRGAGGLTYLPQTTPTTSQIRLQTAIGSSATFEGLLSDFDYISVAIFR